MIVISSSVTTIIASITIGNTIIASTIIEGTIIAIVLILIVVIATHRVEVLIEAVTNITISQAQGSIPQAIDLRSVLNQAIQKITTKAMAVTNTKIIIIVSRPTNYPA